MHRPTRAGRRLFPTGARRPAAQFVNLGMLDDLDTGMLRFAGQKVVEL